VSAAVSVFSFLGAAVLTPGLAIESGHLLIAAGRASRPDGWSRHSDLNRGPAVYETAALPLSYVGADQE
jgi:hypothetical protein